MNMACLEDETDDLPNVPDLESELPLVLAVADFTFPAGCGVDYSKMQHDSLYVINSEEELARIFVCESNPSIDFSTKTLLVAFGGTTNGIATISKELLFENNVYSLTVDITLDMTAVAQAWRIVLITDKINAQSIVLNLNKHFGDPLYGQWTWVKTYAGFHANLLDNEFKSILKITGQNEDGTINYESYVADTLFYKGTFKFEQTQWTNIVIRLPHWTADKDNRWNLLFRNEQDMTSNDTICFYSGNPDDYMFYYTKIE
jgi:hypothetical protein